MRKKLLPFILLICTLSAFGQLNTKRLLDNGRNALYFEDYVISIQYFNQLIELKPQLPEPYFFRAIAKIHLEDYVGADADCSSALKLNPFTPSFYYARGFARKQLGRILEAKIDFDKALEFEPNNFDYTLNRIEAYEQLKEYEKAIADIDTLLSKDNPKNKLLYSAKAQILLQQEDTLKAYEQINIALQKDSTEASFWNIRAYIHLIQKQDKDALSDYNKSLYLNPENLAAYINRGILNYRDKNYLAALSDYDKAIELDSSNTQALFNRGLLRTEVGDYNNALLDFSSVLNIEYDNDDARYQRATLNLSLKNYKSANKDFQQILNKYPDFLPAYYGNADALAALGKNKQAEINRYKAQVLMQDNREGKRNEKKPQNGTQIAENKNSLKEKTNVFDNKENKSRKAQYEDKTRGKIQNQFADADLLGNYFISYYASNDKLRKVNNFNILVDDLNQSNNSNLQITNEEIPFAQAINEIHFKNIQLISSKIEQNKTNAKNYLERGINNNLVVNLEDALADFSQAIELDKGFVLAYFSRANIRYKLLDFALNNAPENQDANTQDKQAKTSRFVADLIIADLDKTLALNKSFYFASYNKANTYALIKDYTKAILCYSEAINRNNEFAEAFFNRGICYLYLNENDKAIADLSKAGELGIYQAYNLIKRYSKK